jgi:hypothetical protein
MFWEEFSGGTDAADIAGLTLAYRAFGQGFLVEWTQSVAWIGDYGPPIAITNDSVSAPIPLGFTANYFGQPVSDISIGSNGFINLGTGTNSAVTVSPAELASGPLRVALLAQALDLSAGGSINVRAITGTIPDTVVTFNEVPLAGSPSQKVLVQVRFQATGSILITYGDNIPPTGLLGLSRGGGLALPPESDVTAALPVYLDGVVAPDLRHEGFPWPAIGQSYDILALDAAPGTLAVVAHLGLSPASIDLTPIGMPGCSIQVLPVLDVLPLFQRSADSFGATLTIPNDTALVGGVLLTQAIELSPGINALDLGVSNALESRIGY